MTDIKEKLIQLLQSKGLREFAAKSPESVKSLMIGTLGYSPYEEILHYSDHVITVYQSMTSQELCADFKRPHYNPFLIINEAGTCTRYHGEAEQHAIPHINTLLGDTDMAKKKKTEEEANPSPELNKRRVHPNHLSPTPVIPETPKRIPYVPIQQIAEPERLFIHQDHQFKYEFYLETGVYRGDMIGEFYLTELTDSSASIPKVAISLDELNQMLRLAHTLPGQLVVEQVYPGGKRLNILKEKDPSYERNKKKDAF